MSEKMVDVRGQQISEDTVVEALRKHCGFQEKYQFKAGDVAKCRGKALRIICRVDGKLHSLALDGSLMSSGQTAFEFYDYEKIGELKDFIRG